MKQKILFCIVAIAGLLAISATNGFTTSSRGRNVNTACAPEEPFTGSNCNLCHTDNNASQPRTYTDAMFAYVSGGNTLTDYFCPTSTTTCIDGDGDGYGNPSDACAYSVPDCDDTDAKVFPGAGEICDDGVDNDCDGNVDCEDSDCDRDTYCLPQTCEGYSIRRSCNKDASCEWDRQLGCQDYEDLSIYTDKDSCLAKGGRWNKRHAICR